MKDDTIFQLQGSSAVNAPSMFRWCMRTCAIDVNSKVKDRAAKMYYLAATWPELPAGLLLALVKENPDLVVTFDEKANTVIVTQEDEV